MNFGYTVQSFVGKGMRPPVPEKVPLDPPVVYLDMDLTADDADEAWARHWLLSCDPACAGHGDASHLGAYRLRYERLARREATGEPAEPVALPAPCFVPSQSWVEKVERAPMPESLRANRARGSVKGRATQRANWNRAFNEAA